MRAGALLSLFTRLACLACVALATACVGDEPPAASTFAETDEFTRQVAGRVIRGTEPVEGSLVQIDPTIPETDVLVDLTAVRRVDTTDAFGRYRVQAAPRLYDLTVRTGRDVFAFPALSARNLDIQLGRDASVRGFSARVVPTIYPPPAPGSSLAYFVTGADARTIAPVPGETGSLEVVFRRYSATLLLHVVEYVTSRGLAGAVREGRHDIDVTNGAAVGVPVVTIEVKTTKTIVFDAVPPPDYALTPLDVVMDFGLRTSTSPVARVAAGQALDIAIVPGGRYFVRGTASGRGASTDSGLARFDPATARFALPLPFPVSGEAPIDDTAQPPASDVTLETGGVFSARISGGVVVHSLAPVTGEGTIEIASSSRITKLIDVTRLGLPHPAGRYLWTMQYFPTVQDMTGFTGEDVRVFFPSSRSVSRQLVLR